MEDVLIQGNNKDHLKIILKDDFKRHGKTIIEIKVGNYFVRGIVWFTTGELRGFYKDLDKMYTEMKLKDSLILKDTENTFNVKFHFNNRGNVIITGFIKKSFIKRQSLNSK
ncbi:hypothetical protein NV379_23000 [Paenibacillus sp. N1-5-1-14]|uniref:WapI family immunity protein n=1 Tax=Paenibacillus radicibacter TaxID=2972488 RepID=UPI002158A980|nr:hypothetical protein [Paenibacillus radicibacter]MCR8645509.1 hypothetical protein [Paenibacillus radicibacter]